MTTHELEVPILGRGDLASFDADICRERGALLLIDKPLHWTSFDVVAKVRRTLGIKKVGHAGTLDPLATGLLILCLGKGTKLAEKVQATEKEYTGTIRFGATTPTEDAEGEEQNLQPYDHLTPDAIREAAESFLGESLQTPPMFSARKVGGKRLYKLARQGKEVERPAKPITIREIEIGKVELPYADFRVVCTKGTYIRSLARDIGERLGTGAYLAGLRRTRSGPFRVEDAAGMEEVASLQGPEQNGKTRIESSDR